MKAKRQKTLAGEKDHESAFGIDLNGSSAHLNLGLLVYLPDVY